MIKSCGKSSIPSSLADLLSVKSSIPFIDKRSAKELGCICCCQILN